MKLKYLQSENIDNYSWTKRFKSNQRDNLRQNSFNPKINCLEVVSKKFTI